MVRKKKTDFNFDEWMEAVPKDKKIIRRNLRLDDNHIRCTIRKHKKREKFYYISFSFREKILLMLDNSDAPRIMFLKHKEDEKRILLTRSPNGYAVQQPNKKNDFYFVRVSFQFDGELNEETILCEPIFHVKGRNSGSVIEIKIPESTEMAQQ